MHVYNNPADGWYCFQCEDAAEGVGQKRGGDIYNLAGWLWGMDPRTEFPALRVRLLEAVPVSIRDRLDPELVARIEAERAKLNGAASTEPLKLDVLSARKTCELPDPPESDQLLGELLTRGSRLVVGAHTGEGKTTISLWIARAITHEEEFLGWQGRGGRVLVIDAEQGLKTVKRRLAEAGLEDSNDVDYVRVPDGLSLDSNEQHVAAVDAVLAAGNYAAVVADPLYKLHTGDSNAEREAVDLMRRFDAWRERHRFGLVLPVHCRKPVNGAKFTMHEFFGSTAYLRGAEVVIGLRRMHAGYSRLHFFKDRDGDLPIGESWGLLFDREEGFKRDPKDNEPTAVELVRELLGEKPEQTVRQLARASDKAEKTIRRALEEIDDEVDYAKGPRGARVYWLLETSEE